MRTLLHVFPGFKVGGTQMRFARLANHFGRTYRHVVVSMNGDTEAAALLAPGLDVTLLEVPVLAGRTWQNLKTFRRIFGDVCPDLLITSNWGSIEWAMANLDSKVSHLHMEDGFGPEEATGQLPRRVWTRRLVLRRSTVLLPSTNLYRLARDVWRLPQRRLIHVPNGVDCDRFDRPPDREFAASFGINGHEPVIGTVAALRSEKNLHRLIDAFALVAARRPARLAIVGDGPEAPSLAAHAAQLNIADRVVFTGACATPERLLPSFAVFALSSDTEQMPLSVLEAMAAGLPLAATDVGDVRRMLAEENHPFVVAKDGDRLAEALSALLDRQDLAHAVGTANGRRAREIYDQGHMFEAYRRLFDGEGVP